CPAADDAESVRGVPVLRSGLRKISGAPFDMSQRGQRRKPARNRIESAAPLVSLTTPCCLDGVLRPREQQLVLRRDEILVEKRDPVVAGVAFGADKPCGGVEMHALGGELI